VSDLGATRLKNIAEPIRVYSLEVGVPAQVKPAAPAQPAAPAVEAHRPAVAAAFIVVALAAGAYVWHSGLAPYWRMDNKEAKAEFEQALKLDPNYARAQAGLAFALTNLANYPGATDHDAHIDQAALEQWR
jgi:tetratricopeptide repeat protein